jgi:hypothetical protein
MTKTIKTISYASVAVIIGLAFMATQVFANHSWGGFHWDLSTAASITNPLDLGDNLTNGWSTNLASTSIDWNKFVIKNEIVSGRSNANCDPTLGGVEVCNGLYGDNGWLGIAQVWTYRRGGHIDSLTRLGKWRPATNGSAGT